MILQELHQENKAISGQRLAERLNVSRTAIWKGIEQLRDEGYAISSVSGKGYQLDCIPAKPSAYEIQRLCRDFWPELTVETYDSVTSTNDLAKQWLDEREEGQELLIIAKEQTAGRGRRGKAFFSQLDQGLYFSLTVDVKEKPKEELYLYTLLVGVSVCEAIEAVAPHIEGLKLKWVNDLFYRGKKIGGILSEAVTHLEDGSLPGLVLGVGLNLSGQLPEGPLESVAGTLFESPMPEEFNLNFFFAHFLKIFQNYHLNFENKTFLDAYRQRLLGVGQWVYYEDRGQKGEGELIGIDDRGQLILRNDLHEIITLSNHQIHFDSSQFVEVDSHENATTD